MAKIRTEKRDVRIRRIADALGIRFEAQRENLRLTDKRLSAQMMRTSVFKRKKKPDPEKLKIPGLNAYDLETTSINKGTPKPLYLTACGADLWVSQRIKNIESLCDMVIQHLLTEEKAGQRYIAHNGNKFDAYFISASLLHEPDYHIQPYLAGDSNFRGMKITQRSTGHVWEFLDSMSMTGCLKSLKDFLKTFAPEYGKLESPDFENEQFNGLNKKHREYAERDSEGLYHAINAAQNVVFETFGMGLQATVGNLGIKLFAQHIPENIGIHRPPHEALKIIRNYLMRGGYCHLQKQYRGPVWRYDINQAYAAAMRDGILPGGRCMKTSPGKSKYSRCAMYRVKAFHKNNTIPFYYNAISDGKSKFSCTEIEETWLTSVETDQLEKEGWKIDYLETYIWETGFNMKEYVDKLEKLRHSGIGGTKGAQGEMIKAIGNNSYGKTVEKLRPYELCMCAECPEGWGAYYDDDSPFQHVWFRFTKDDKTREYHQPQIGAFITAHVRMVLRRAILQAPDAFIYADTDGVTFTRPVSLPIDSKIYGQWKIEAENEPYIFIDKKVYCSEDFSVRHAKGLNIRKLTYADFVSWYETGEPPVQRQIQRNSFLRVMSGANMFREVVKRGSNKWARENSANGNFLKSA